jgi:hypothetical protein
MCELALFQLNALEDVVGGEMDAPGCGKDVAVNLCLNQQFNPFMCGVSVFQHIAIEALQQQCISGNHVVFDNQMHQCLLIVVAIPN